MANLLAKLRIDYSSLIMLQDVTQSPRPETVQLHQQLLKSFDHLPAHLTPPELSSPERVALAEKTHRQLRLREMLLDHSLEARLIVMSMPMPRMVRLPPETAVCKRLNCSLFLPSHPGYRFGLAVHVLVGDAVQGHATDVARARQPDFSIDVLLLGAVLCESRDFSV